MRIDFQADPNYQSQHYALLEFKGKFDLGDDQEAKRAVRIGDLADLGLGQFKLEVGVLDLIGSEVKCPSNLVYTERQPTGEQGHCKVTIKGIITKKILFERRPAPNMERATIDSQPRQMSIFNTAIRPFETGAKFGIQTK